MTDLKIGPFILVQGQTVLVGQLSNIIFEIASSTGSSLRLDASQIGDGSVTVETSHLITALVQGEVPRPLIREAMAAVRLKRESEK